MIEIREGKQAAKKVELELEEKYRHKGLVFENRRLMAENLERERTVEGYKELNRIMDERNSKAEAEVARLKVQLRTDGGDSSETDFESCIESATEDEGASIYEHAEKSPKSRTQQVPVTRMQKRPSSKPQLTSPTQTKSHQLTLNGTSNASSAPTSETTTPKMITRMPTWERSWKRLPSESAY